MGSSGVARAGGWCALIVLLCAGCTAHPVGPARTFGSYEGKAATTAASGASAVATVQMAARAAADGGATGAYTGAVVSEQEDAIAGVSGTFGSIQPPDRRSDALRRRLTRELDDALDAVADVRIAVRRGSFDRLDALARRLDADHTALESFAEEHRG